jgi:hypothetical protein
LALGVERGDGVRLQTGQFLGPQAGDHVIVDQDAVAVDRGALDVPWNRVEPLFEVLTKGAFLLGLLSESSVGNLPEQFT